MAILRMIQVEYETDNPGQVAEIIRLCLTGQSTPAAIKPEVRTQITAPAPVAPAPSNGGKTTFVIPPKPSPINKLTSPQQEKLLELLRREPLSTGDLIKRSGLTASAVYQALSVLKQGGVVESRNDTDTHRKNFVKENG